MSFLLNRRDLLTAGALSALVPRPLLATSTALVGDVELLRRAYEALHPGLYRYNTPAQTAARFDALAAWARQPRTLAESYLAFARITAAVRCGHSYPNFYNQKQALRQTLFEQRNRLPFLFDWIGGRMIVLRDLSDAGLPPGTEILSVGRMPAAAMLRALMPLSRADGSNDGKRTRNLSVRGQDEWEAFDIYAPLLFADLFARPDITLAVCDPRGRTRRVAVGLMTRDERFRAQGVPSTIVPDAPLWSFAQDGIAAWLTMPDWGVYRSKWDWKTWLDDRLDTIARDGTRTLVVDLRGNEGGQDCGDVILARLIDRDLRDFDGQRRTRYRRVPAALDPFLDTWDDSFRDWGTAAVGPDAAGFYRLTRWDDDARGSLLRPAGKRFHGKLIVLVDAANSSATFQFAQRVKDNRLGTLIGETTGGNRRGVNGGGFFFLRLPASGIEVDVPLVGEFPAKPQPDAGVQPDVRVARTVADIARGRDPVRAAALAMA